MIRAKENYGAKYLSRLYRRFFNTPIPNIWFTNDLTVERDRILEIEYSIIEKPFHQTMKKTRYNKQQSKYQEPLRNLKNHEIKFASFRIGVGS